MWLVSSIKKINMQISLALKHILFEKPEFLSHVN